MEISKTKISLLASLQTKKMRMRHGLFIVEGEKSVRDTLGAFVLVNLVATENWMESYGPCIGVSPDKILTATPAAMRKISSLSTAPEVLALFRIPEPDDSDPILRAGELYLLLDGIQDPGNLGTIIRTADWFGFDHIYASRDTADIYNSKTVQSTMGSLKRVRVTYTDLEALIERSDIRNIYGTMLEGEDMFRTEQEREGVIIMGNEGNGLSEGIRRHVNRPLFISPYDPCSHAESLNVAVATGIVLAKFRQPNLAIVK